MKSAVGGYCFENGGKIQIKEVKDEIQSICVFSDDSKCEQWQYFEGKCQPKNTKSKPTASDFQKFINKSTDIETIFSNFGEPDADIGSGIHIYVYNLENSQIWIGYADKILYVKHVDADGKHHEQLQ